MKTDSLPVVYLNAASTSEREVLAKLLSPYSWADGEHGMMLTDVALVKCVKESPPTVLGVLRESLVLALNETKRIGAGDVCLNAL